jgi:hypothetical protein
MNTEYYECLGTDHLDKNNNLGKHKTRAYLLCNRTSGLAV